MLQLPLVTSSGQVAAGTSPEACQACAKKLEASKILSSCCVLRRVAAAKGKPNVAELSRLCWLSQSLRQMQVPK